MNRETLSSEMLAPKALSFVSGYHNNVVKEVASAVTSNKVVVVGMAQNPFVGKARKALKAASVEFKYLEYGSYVSQWKQRLAIKLWSGWPTYPQVFISGKLIGGFKELEQEIAAGTLK
jgi:glutaredoxin-related protein